MKNYLVLLLIVSAKIYAQKQYTVKIKEIDSTQSYYFIKAHCKEMPKKNILIISENDPTSNGCTKLQENKKYRLTLNDYFSEKEINNFPAKPLGTLKINIDGYVVWKGESNLPYKSPDIKSLCFVKDKL